MRDSMIALIKIRTTTPEIICEPFASWIDPIAFSIFDCYGYSLCADYIAPEDDTIPQFEFSTREIENPYRQSEDDPETVIQRIATQVIE